jgi:hypothetical protein
MLLALAILAIRREYRRFAGDRRNYPYGWEPEAAHLFAGTAPSRKTLDEPLYDSLPDEDDALLSPPAR